MAGVPPQVKAKPVKARQAASVARGRVALAARAKAVAEVAHARVAEASDKAAALARVAVVPAGRIDNPIPRGRGASGN